MLDAVLDILFPPEHCSICRKSGRFTSKQPWCEECWNQMLKLHDSGNNCQRCGRYIREDSGLCADCSQQEPEFDLARAAGPYEEQFRIATKVLKFMGKKYLAPRMGSLMAEQVRQEPGFGHIDLIVPVPLSPNSLQTRGFNQTELLARQIGRELGIKVDYGAIVRVRDTPHQTELNREERERNLLCAFAVRDNLDLTGQSILLVDDVYTTGSTARECTRVLLQAGAKRVCIITWATGRSF